VAGRACRRATASAGHASLHETHPRSLIRQPACGSGAIRAHTIRSICMSEKRTLGLRLATVDQRPHNRRAQLRVHVWFVAFAPPCCIFPSEPSGPASCLGGSARGSSLRRLHTFCRLCAPCAGRLPQRGSRRGQAAVGLAKGAAVDVAWRVDVRMHPEVLVRVAGARVDEVATPHQQLAHPQREQHTTIAAAAVAAAVVAAAIIATAALATALHAIALSATFVATACTSVATASISATHTTSTICAPTVPAIFPALRIPVADLLQRGGGP